MSTSVAAVLVERIRQMKPGTIFVAEDLRDVGTRSSVYTVLSSLEKTKEILRLSHGIYVVPRRDSELGAIRPTVDEIVQVVAQKSGAKIIPGGALALNKLGISTQVPMNYVYLTDGPSRRMMIGKAKVAFKKTAPRYFKLKGELSQLVVQSLRELGKEGLTNEIRHKLLNQLSKEKRPILEHDVKYVPAWISDLFYESLNKGLF